MLALAGGGSSSTAAAAGGEVSAAAKAAVAQAAAAAAGGGDAAAEPTEPLAPPALVRAGELRALIDSAREGLAAERAVLPKVYDDLLVLDPVDSRLLEEKLGPMVQGVPDAGEVLALSDQLYPTRPASALPRGAVSVVNETPPPPS